MAEKDNASKAAVAVSMAAAIASAIALLKARRVEAVPPAPAVISLDEATMNLLIAIAEASGSIDSNVLEALDKLQQIIDKIGVGGVFQGWPPNAEGTRSFVVLCVAANQAYQASDMTIPDGMALAIKASPLNAVGSLIYVATSIAESTNPNSAWPLVPNEAITYHVKNANVFYVSSNVAGSIAIFTAEQRK